MFHGGGGELRGSPEHSWTRRTGSGRWSCRCWRRGAPENMWLKPGGERHLRSLGLSCRVTWEGSEVPSGWFAHIYWLRNVETEQHIVWKHDHVAAGKCKAVEMQSVALMAPSDATGNRLLCNKLWNTYFHKRSDGLKYEKKRKNNPEQQQVLSLHDPICLKVQKLNWFSLEREARMTDYWAVVFGAIKGVVWFHVVIDII